MVASLSEETWVEADCDEAFAALKTTDFASEVMIWDAHFEGNSLTIVNAVRDVGYLFTPFGHNLSQTHHQRLGFRRFCISHTQREGNKVAHALAKMAKSVVWLEDTPPNLATLLCLVVCNGFLVCFG